MYDKTPKQVNNYFASCVAGVTLSPVAMKRYSQRTFRPWEENRERLEFADKLGFNVSELINEVLKENLQTHMSSKVEKLRKALSTPAK